MQKFLNIYPERCTGCRLCELVCSLKKTGEFNPLYSRIHVTIFTEEAFYIPLTCTQCAEAWCINACPVSAISRNFQKNVVLIDDDKCVGCKMCTYACPFGVLTYNSLTDKAIKCDHCDGHPECVLFCPSSALCFEEVKASTADKREETAKKLLVAHKVSFNKNKLAKNSTLNGEIDKGS